MIHNQNKLLKKELMELFRKFGYLSEEKDHELTIMPTSGNFAWIIFICIEILKESYF